MTLSRPIIIALVGAVAAVGLFMYTRSTGSGESIPANAPSASPAKSDSKDKPPASARGHKASSTPGKPGARAPSGPTPVSVPPPVARAMVQHKVVLVLFWSRGGPEDNVAKRVVDRVRSGLPANKVAVFEDSPRNVAKYSLIAGDVSRSPSIVVVDRALRSKVVSGFADYTTIVHLVRQAEAARAS